MWWGDTRLIHMHSMHDCNDVSVCVLCVYVVEHCVCGRVSKLYVSVCDGVQGICVHACACAHDCVVPSVSVVRVCLVSVCCVWMMESLH